MENILLFSAIINEANHQKRYPPELLHVRGRRNIKLAAKRLEMKKKLPGPTCAIGDLIYYATKSVSKKREESQKNNGKKRICTNHEQKIKTL